MFYYSSIAPDTANIVKMETSLPFLHYIAGVKQ